MFYIRTGANGSCKTLFTLFDIRKLQLETGRPVAFNKNFKPKPILTDEFGWTLIDDVKEWEKQPFGTIFLIDEAYKDFPVRPNGQQPPKHVERLAEHRSMGFDFFMLALHPSTIDSFVRKAVGAPGWHQHLKRVGGASPLTRVFQWDAVNMNCEKDGSGKTAQIENRVQPKQVYEWYESAYIHTGKVRIPKQVWWLCGAVCMALGAGYFGYQSLLNNTVRKATPAALAAASGGAPATPGRAGGSDKATVLTAAEYSFSYQPRIPGLMHTAPAYDGVTAPKRAPVPAACIEMKLKGCKCFTQDATPYPIDTVMCHQIATGGIFLAFAEGTSPARERVSPASAKLDPIEHGRMVSIDTVVTVPISDTKSTVSRDGEVLAFMRKREYIK